MEKYRDPFKNWKKYIKGDFVCKRIKNPFFRSLIQGDFFAKSIARRVLVRIQDTIDVRAV